MDGGSTDHSVDVIRKYKDRVTGWESQPDRGQSHAINKAWDRSTGEYIWWLNSDDMLMPNALFKAVEFLMNRPSIDLIYGDVHRIDDRDRWLGRFDYLDFDFEEFVIKSRNIAQAGALARRSAVEAVGKLNESYHYLMDRDFWIRLVFAGKRIAHMDIPLAIFRIHPESKTQAGSSAASDERVRLTKAILADPRLPDSVRAKSTKVWTNVHLGRARVYMKCGLYLKSLQALYKAFRLRPSVLAQGRFLLPGILSSIGIVIGFRSIERIRSASRVVRRGRATLGGRWTSGG